LQVQRVDDLWPGPALALSLQDLPFVFLVDELVRGEKLNGAAAAATAAAVSSRTVRSVIAVQLLLDFEQVS
jgi:hypothetical protein